MYIQKNRNPDAFGLWGFESQVNVGRANLTDITTDVNNNVSDMVLMVNSHEQWEMEISTITLEIDLSTSYYNAFDILQVPFLFTLVIFNIKIKKNHLKRLKCICSIRLKT